MIPIKDNQIFSLQEVQSMWDLLRNLLYVWRSVILVKWMFTNERDHLKNIRIVSKMKSNSQ